MHVRKIIFFGAQGKGKSTVLNSSAGSLISQSKPSADFIALTKELQHKNVGNITYCDTPGFMTAQHWASEREKEKSHEGQTSSYYHPLKVYIITKRMRRKIYSGKPFRPLWPHNHQ